tara:strand:- start:300 stop:509 length:210 start_codon:yes stop_codon:yes gene_type:complete
MNIIDTQLEKIDFSQPLSLKKIRNRSRINGKLISKKYMIRYLHESPNYRNVKPLEVGSHKHKLNVWAKV